MFDNFYYSNPVKIFFGKGVVERIGEVTSQYGRKVLLVTGTGSVKRLGVYSEVVRNLNKHGLRVFELSGIKSSPGLDRCHDGSVICKQNNIDVIVALGGGSVLDTAKTISFAALSDENIWDFFEKKTMVRKALPVISVMTVAATGSEFNNITVIKNEQAHKKESIWNENLFPKVSFLDPQLTFSLPPKYTAYGAVDILTHVLERYVTNISSPVLQLRIKESIMTTVMENVEAVLDNPANYDARASLMWSSSLACSQMLDLGNETMDIPCHTIDIELGGLYDVPHGANLAVLLPAFMLCKVKEFKTNIERFSTQVMKVEKKTGSLDLALEGIKEFRTWLAKIGCPTTLKELGYKKDDFELVADRVMSNPYWHYDRETVLQVLEIYY